MFLDDNVVALNEVILACRDAAARYETAAKILDDENLSNVFRELAAGREQTALRMENALKHMGHLPSEPDPDKQALKILWTKVKAAVKNNEKEVLFSECMALEIRIDEKCKDALEQPIPESVIGILIELKQESTAFRQWLEREGDH